MVQPAIQLLGIRGARVHRSSFPQVFGPAQTFPQKEPTVPQSADNFDYVIVGGGSAGCVIANRLSADPRTRVLLLEAGGADDYFWLKVPLALPFVLGNPRCDWCLKSEPEKFLGGRVLDLPRGKTLGGSSSINGMVYVRGHAFDFDRWRQDGNSGWAWDDVLPYFKRSEDYFAGASPTHGEGGELAVTDPGVRWPILDAYKLACIEAGIPEAHDYNGGDNEGVAYFEAMIRKGRRCSTSQAFLRPAARRPNLKVVTQAHVTRLVLTNRRVTSVEYRVGDAVRSAEAGGEVILCAGAIGSPQILQVSGIGPGALLNGLGIPVHHELPGVGENLQDHWMIRVQHRVENTTTLNAWTQSLIGRAGLGLRYFLTRRGPLSAQPALLAVFAKTAPDREMPDVQIHVSAASYERVGGPMHPFPGMTSSACILRPTSRGHVRIKTRSSEDQPAIVHNFLETPHDRDIAVRALGLVREIVAQPALRPFKPRELSPPAGTRSVEQVLNYACRTATTVFHPVGTCAMGRGERAVVDERLRLHGLAGLRIADASIMPTITSGNTCAPVIMIAEKAADLIREDRKRPTAAG
jgi:choline dehydrogenase